MVEDLPYDREGRPFPTLYWATCPALVAAIGRLEGGGGVRRQAADAAADPVLRDSLAAATRYERRRRRELVRRYGLPMADGGASLRTGIAGVGVSAVAERDPAPNLKCLHAHAAHALARPGYALGERVLAEAAPLWGDSQCCSPGTRAASGESPS